MTPHAAAPRPAPSTLMRASALMLDDLEVLRREELALDRRLRAVQSRIEALSAPLAAALAALGPEEREAARARHARIEAEHGRAPRRLGLTPASEALIAFLAAHPSGTVSAAEAQAHLAGRGLAPRPRHAALALARLQRAGLVTRRLHGTYTIHHDHPELVARRAAPPEAGAATRR